MKGGQAVLISIQPKWVNAINHDGKTIEVRRNRPILNTPFKCYIYQSKGPETVFGTIKDGDEIYDGEIYHGKTILLKMPKEVTGRERQKIVGEFICDSILCYNMNDAGITLLSNGGLFRKSCLTEEEVRKYAMYDAGYLRPHLYGWHISQLKWYYDARPLSDFGLDRPPQSWCYVEELKE